jgi:histidyl-tRNA synthetase
MLDCKSDRCQPIIADAPHISNHLCGECESHFLALQEYLRLQNREYAINHRLVRGLDYYTKTVFEVWAAGIGAQAAVCGGGRYDGLAELLGGPATPGVGFGSGLERIILVMKQLDVQVPTIPTPPVYLVHLGIEAKREALRLAYDLRREGIGAWIAFGERGLRSQLREANKRSARYAIILGEDELVSGTATVRDMQSGEQISLDLTGLVDWLGAQV